MATSKHFALLILVLVYFCVQISDCANILAVLPLFLKSHSIFTHAIVKELGFRGHNVTILTPFPDPDPPPNYRQILADQKTCWEPEVTDEQRETFLSGDVPFVLSQMERWDSMLWFTEVALNSSDIKDFLVKDNSQYDLIIGELFLQEALLMINHKYKAPFILLSTLDGHHVSQSSGSPTLSSVIPFEFGKTFEIKNVYDRTINVLGSLFDWFGRRYYVLPQQQALADKYLGHLTKPLPKLQDIEKNVSLVLVNAHFSMDFMRPVVPGMIDVAGVHIKPPKPLPQNIKEFVENATDGVIYFSLGTIISSSKFPPKRVQALFSAFSGLKQRVVWKWDSELPKSNVSSNIMLTKWAPQADLLAHPNTRLFITHGGFLGMTEAVYFGVPILGIPLFGDQFSNIERAIKLGYGAKLLYRDINEENLKTQLNEILHNPTYSKNSKKISKLFNDKPMSPMDEAMFWIEYVLRNNGARHLRSPIFDLKFYQYFLLDVALLVSAATCAVSVLVYLAIGYLRKLFKRKSKEKAKDE